MGTSEGAAKRKRCPKCGQFDHGDRPCGIPGRKLAPMLDRIWQRITKLGPDDCWVWPGDTDHAGYGQIGGSSDPPERRGHISRFLLEEKLGRPLHPGTKACHTCDNPPCCNPAHLFEGTQQDNLDDMVAKGRSNRGDKHWNVKLTPEQVDAIRQDPRSSTVIGKEYNVQPRQIRRIRQGTRWQG